MKNPMLILSTCFVFMTTACQNASNNQKTQHDADTTMIIHDEHNSQNSLDWAGTYQDTIPCADCPGILTTIKLYDNGTYSYKAEYLERNTTLQDTGRFMWHDNGGVVHLKGKEINSKYKVGENVLLQLDTEGKPIEGNIAKSFSLQKVF